MFFNEILFYAFLPFPALGVKSALLHTGDRKRPGATSSPFVVCCTFARSPSSQKKNIKSEKKTQKQMTHGPQERLRFIDDEQLYKLMIITSNIKGSLVLYNRRKRERVRCWTFTWTWVSTSCRMFLSSRSFSASRYLVFSKRTSILCCQVRRSSASEATAASAASARAAFSSASWRSNSRRSSSRRAVHSARQSASLASNCNQRFDSSDVLSLYTVFSFLSLPVAGIGFPFRQERWSFPSGTCRCLAKYKKESEMMMMFLCRDTFLFPLLRHLRSRLSCSSWSWCWFFSKWIWLRNSTITAWSAAIIPNKYNWHFVFCFFLKYYKSHNSPPPRDWKSGGDMPGGIETRQHLCSRWAISTRVNTTGRTWAVSPRGRGSTNPCSRL